MTPDNPREVALLLIGCVFGALGSVVFAALAVWFVEVRNGLREGELSGEELERSRRREESR